MTHGEIITALQTVRRGRGLSLRKVAASAHTSSASILEWERGSHAPTLPNLIEWAAALGFSVLIQPAGLPLEHVCPDCRVERADYEGPDGQYLPECPNCGSTTAPARAN